MTLLICGLICRVKLLEHLQERALLALQGPKAANVLARHIDNSEILSDLTFMSFKRLSLSGHDVTVARAGYTGEDGFELSVSTETVEEVANLICSEPEVEPIGLGARDSLRLGGRITSLWS